MAITNQRFPVRSTTKGTIEFRSLWSTPGSAGNLTRDFAIGVFSVTRLGAGRYSVQFSGTNKPSGKLLGVAARAHGVTTVAGLQGSCVFSTYDRTAGTLTVEFFNGAGTLTDPILATHPKVELNILFTLGTL